VPSPNSPDWLSPQAHKLPSLFIPNAWTEEDPDTIRVKYEHCAWMRVSAKHRMIKPVAKILHSKGVWVENVFMTLF
jgi:hypothetical protein